VNSCITICLENTTAIYVKLVNFGVCSLKVLWELSDCQIRIFVTGKMPVDPN